MRDTQTAIRSTENATRNTRGATRLVVFPPGAMGHAERLNLHGILVASAYHCRRPRLAGSEWKTYELRIADCGLRGTRNAHHAIRPIVHVSRFSFHDSTIQPA